MLKASRIAATALAMSLVATPMVAANPATAEEKIPQVCSGNANWNIRQSFLKYIDGGIAHGKIEATNGVTYSGQGINGRLDYEVDPSRSTIWSSTRGVIGLKGNLHFTGHGGVLDMNASDLKVEVNGTSGKILADWKASAVDEMLPGAKVTDWNEGSDSAIAVLTFDKAPNLTNGTVDLTSAKAEVTAAGSKFFQGYEAGEELANVSAKFTTGPECGKQPGSGPVGTDPSDGSDGGILGILGVIAALGAVFAGIYAWAVSAGLVPGIR